MATVAFNDRIYAQAALQAFVAKLAPLNAFSRSYDSEAKKKGDTIVVPLISGATATTFNQSYEVGGGSSSVATISLNKHKIASVDLTDVQVANSSMAKLEDFGYQAGEALANLVLQDIWSVITTANFGAASVTTAQSNWDLSEIIAFRKVLAQRNVPLDKISLFFDTEIGAALLGNSNILQAYAFGGTEAVRGGNLGRQLVGMTPYETNVLPSAVTSLVAFAAHPDSIALAMRYLAPLEPSAYASTMQLTHESGITMGWRRHYQPATGKLYGNFECLYGFTPALTLGLVLATKP